MPKNKSAAIRYRIIDAQLNSKKHRFPSLVDLAEKCSEILGVDISTSTIEKDIAEMRKPLPRGYGAPIVFAKIEGGYVYGEVGFSIAELNLEEEEWSALQFAAQLLYQYKEVPIFTNFKSAIERINTRFALDLDGNDQLIEQVIQFEKSVETKGMEWIETIYTAIKEKKGVSFTYSNIYKRKTGNTELVPYLIKEHRNRWYVIGWNEEKGIYATYGLDRVDSLAVLSNTHKRRYDFNASTFFQHSTGIMENKTKPEEIVLTIKKPISDLILLEPLHHSQKIMLEKADKIQISLKVFINEELMLRLLGMGSNCIIQKPTALRNKIKLKIQEMQSNYL
jgi:predicted DNA-binding transcriptional regulator YafY